MSRLSRPAVTAAVGAALVVPLAALPASPALADSHTVTVVHGIPGTPVDVYAGGQRLIDDFQPGDVVSTADAPTGPLDVAIVPADASDASNPILSGTVTVPSSGSVDLVAHLNAQGQPALTPFTNDSGDNVVVRHTAAAPAVDVLVDGQPALTGLTNPNEATATLPAGNYQVAVALAGTTDPVLGPVQLQAEAGETYTAYATGSAEQDTLELVLVLGSERAASPSSVDAGSGGTAPGSAGVMLPLVFFGGLLAAGGTVAVARRRP